MAAVLRAGSAVWLLAQAFWVGALWVVPLLVVPVLHLSDLAPLLVGDLVQLMAGAVVLVAMVGALIQVLLLIWLRGLNALVRDQRGRLLQLCLLLMLGSLALLRWAPDAQYLQTVCYLLLAVNGLRLVLQPAPLVTSLQG